PPPKPAAKPDDPAIKVLVEDVLKKRDEDKKKADEAKKKEEEAKGYEIGSDLKLAATWNNGLVLQNEHKDFRVHIGGRINYDTVFWNQDRKSTRLNSSHEWISYAVF